MLEFLRIILSTQVVSGAVVCAFLYLFKGDVKALMARIARIRLPGGSEFSTTQLEKETEGVTAKQKPPDVPQSDKPQIPEGLHLSADQVESIKQVFNAERANSYLWEYRYLNLF